MDGRFEEFKQMLLNLTVVRTYRLRVEGKLELYIHTYGIVVGGKVIFMQFCCHGVL